MATNFSRQRSKIVFPDHPMDFSHGTMYLPPIWNRILQEYMPNIEYLEKDLPMEDDEDDETDNSDGGWPTAM
jgi:hypothetical protein